MLALMLAAPGLENVCHHARFGLQGGTLYGLWGTLLVAYGIVFSTAIDLLGEQHPFTFDGSEMSLQQATSCCMGMGVQTEVGHLCRSERQLDSLLHHQRCRKVRCSQ